MNTLSRTLAAGALTLAALSTTAHAVDMPPDLVGVWCLPPVGNTRATAYWLIDPNQPYEPCHGRLTVKHNGLTCEEFKCVPTRVRVTGHIRQWGNVPIYDISFVCSHDYPREKWRARAEVHAGRWLSIEWRPGTDKWPPIVEKPRETRE